MKKILLGCCFFIVICSSSFALLPPFYQSSKEIKHLLSDPRLAEKLGSGQMILQIIRTNTGYLIVTPQKRLDVEIHYFYPKYKTGPAEYEFNFQEPVEIDSQK